MKNDLYHFKKPTGLTRRFLLLAGFMILGLLNPLIAQKTYNFTGTVTNKQGETMPGVNVIIKGDVSHGTSTDLNGKFTLTSPVETATLVFSFIGSLSQEVQAKAGVPLSVVLQDKSIGLSELVVIGYGVQKKSVVTGAISSVKASDLTSQQIPRLETALQGRTSGLTIASSSGQPGSGATVRIRGVTSWNDKASDPLYVVDGVPVDIGGIDYLSPSDIESIEVLKDAASAAIYGTRAAGGVILVTTKKGKSGSLQVSYNAYIGTQAPAKRLKLLNATEYALLQNEAAKNSGAVQPFPFLDQNPDSLGVGTDWQDAIFNNHAGIQNHELSISGGNDRSTYYASMAYYNQEGIVTTDISKYKRINIRFNSAHKVKNWLRFGNNIGYSHIKSQGSLNTNSEYGGPLASAINLDPITPLIETNQAVLNKAPYSSDFPIIYDPNGFPFGISTRVMQEMSNPLAYVQTKLGNYGWSDNIVGNVYAEVEPLKGLVVKSDLGAKLAFWGDESFTPRFYLNAANTNLGNNSFSRSMNQGFRWNFENTLAYTRSFGLHNITGLIGTSAFLENSRGVSTTYYSLPVTNFEDASMNFSLSSENRVGSGWESANHSLASTFARLIYNYDERYLFTGIARRDGSSRFGSNNKYHIFPSASFGWVVSREGFWQENKYINFLKTRFSYGVTGSEELGSEFAYVSMISSGFNYTFGEDEYIIGYAPAALANQDLMWEQTSQTNLGFDATLFDYFSFTLDLFDKRTTGILRPIVLPEYSGTGNPWGNVASMSNKGIELELGFKRQIGAVYLDLSGRTSYVKNKITDLGTKDYEPDKYFQSSSYEISCLKEGYPMGSFYGFEILGVFHKQSDILSYTDPSTGNLIQPNAQPGDFKFADLNGDGAITADDRTIIGSPIPTWSFGFTLNANYKGFDIQVFGQGVAGNKIFNGLRRLDMPSANWTTVALDRWTPDNAMSDFPRLTLGSDPNKNFTSPSSFYLSDGSYLRIKTLQIGYTLPKSFLSIVGIDKLRLYISSNNLFTLTKYSGFEPEIGGGSYSIDRGVYPQARSFLAGVNVTF